MKNPDESWEDYLYNSLRGGCVSVRFKGYEPFKELFFKGIIVPNVTGIRIMYSGLTDVIYCANKRGELFEYGSDDALREECSGFDPEWILSENMNPDGWEVEGIKPKGYDERRVR